MNLIDKVCFDNFEDVLIGLERSSPEVAIIFRLTRSVEVDRLLPIAAAVANHLADALASQGARHFNGWAVLPRSIDEFEEDWNDTFLITVGNLPASPNKLFWVMTTLDDVLSKETLDDAPELERGVSYKALDGDALLTYLRYLNELADEDQIADAVLENPLLSFYRIDSQGVRTGGMQRFGEFFGLMARDELRFAPGGTS